MSGVLKQQFSFAFYPTLTTQCDLAKYTICFPEEAITNISMVSLSVGTNLKLVYYKNNFFKECYKSNWNPLWLSNSNIACLLMKINWKSHWTNNTISTNRFKIVSPNLWYTMWRQTITNYLSAIYKIYTSRSYGCNETYFFWRDSLLRFPPVTGKHLTVTHCSLLTLAKRTTVCTPAPRFPSLSSKTHINSSDSYSLT